MIAAVPATNMSRFLVRSVHSLNVTEDIDHCVGLQGPVSVQTPASPLSSTYTNPSLVSINPSVLASCLIPDGGVEVEVTLHWRQFTRWYLLTDSILGDS